MPSAIGRQTDIGIAKETVRGTAATAVFWLPHASLTFDEQVQQVIDEASVGRIEDSTDANITEKFSEGTLEGMIRAEDIGLLLLNTVGAVSTSLNSPETGVQTHTFSVKQDAQHPSLTISLKEPNSSKQFPLGMINSLELEIVLNQYARFSAGIRAQKGAAAALTPVYVAADERKVFLPQHGTFKVASSLAGLAAAAETKIRNFTLTIDKNLEDDQVIGSLDPADILNKQFSISGSVELLFKSTAFIDDLLADTKQAMRITLENTDITIGATTNPKLEIDLARVSFSEVTQPFSNDDLIVQTVSFDAHYSISDAKMLDVKLINETTSY